jgi:hypothetical protein
MKATAHLQLRTVPNSSFGSTEGSQCGSRPGRSGRRLCATQYAAQARTEDAALRFSCGCARHNVSFRKSIHLISRQKLVILL